jgi:Lipid A core - O-antigen ligase and related enzymes
MNAVLTLITAAYLAYAALNVFRRPGLFCAAFMLSHGLAVYFGSVGPICGGIALAVSAAAINQDRSQKNTFWGEWAFAIWIGMACASMFTSLAPDVTAVYVGSGILLAAGSYIYARAFSNTPNFFVDLLISVVVLTILCSVKLYMVNKGGLFGEGNGYTHVGLGVIPEICLALVPAYFVFGKNIKPVVFIGLLLFLFVVVIPVTFALGTRSVFLGAGVGVVILLVLKIRLDSGRILIPVLASVAVFALCVALLWEYLQTTPIGLLLSMGSTRLVHGFLTGGVSSDASAQERLHLFSQAVDLFHKAPIFGQGAGAFGYLADRAGGAYPHNMLLELLVQSGIVGTLLFFFFIGDLLRRSWRDLMSPTLDWTVAAIFMAFIADLSRLQVSMTVSQAKMLFFALGCLAARRLAEHSALGGDQAPELPVRDLAGGEKL